MMCIVITGSFTYFVRFFFFYSDVIDAEWDWVSWREKNSYQSFRTNYDYLMIGEYKFLSIPRGMWKGIKWTKKVSLASNSR